MENNTDVSDIEGHGLKNTMHPELIVLNRRLQPVHTRQKTTTVFTYTDSGQF